MKDLLLRLSDEVFKNGKPSDKLLAQCTAAALADAAGDGWVRFARTMAQCCTPEGMHEALRGAKDLRPAVRRHAFVIAVREMLLGRPMQHHLWFDGLKNCAEYMDAPADPALIDYLRPQYEFAEFMCCAFAVTRGQKNVKVLKTEWLPHQFGTDVHGILGMLDATEDDFEKHPVLREWLARAKNETQPAF